MSIFTDDCLEGNHSHIAQLLILTTGEGQYSAILYSGVKVMGSEKKSFIHCSVLLCGSHIKKNYAAKRTTLRRVELYVVEVKSNIPRSNNFHNIPM
jgi:hypothetical protein